MQITRIRHLGLAHPLLGAHTPSVCEQCPGAPQAFDCECHRSACLHRASLLLNHARYVHRTHVLQQMVRLATALLVWVDRTIGLGLHRVVTGHPLLHLKHPITKLK